MNKPLKIVISVDHMGKPHRPHDRGAIAQTCINTTEADLCLEYAQFVYKSLTELGHSPFLVTHGTYGYRAAFSNQIEADLYFACHLNSSEIPPRNNYSLLELYRPGKLTRRFANHLSDVFAERLPVYKSEVKTIKNRTDRGAACINRVKAPAILLEPLFLNHPDGIKYLINNPTGISEAIVSAIITFGWDEKTN